MSILIRAWLSAASLLVDDIFCAFHVHRWGRTYVVYGLSMHRCSNCGTRQPVKVLEWPKDHHDTV